MTKQTQRRAPSSSRSARQDEVSRVIRITPMLKSLELAQTEPFLVRVDAWAAFAVVLLASSATWFAAVWILERWQLR